MTQTAWYAVRWFLEKVKPAAPPLTQISESGKISLPSLYRRAVVTKKNALNSMKSMEFFPAILGCD